MQHINIKFFIKNAETIDLEDVIKVFHIWIQKQRLDDLLIDVADYRHVPSGPGVILIGHHANYSFDNSGGHLGVLYNRKSAIDTKVTTQVKDALHANLHICRLLASEAIFGGKFKLVSDSMQVIINDRLLAANNDTTFVQFLPELRTALVDVFGDQDYEFNRANDPRKRMMITVKLPKSFTL